MSTIISIDENNYSNNDSAASEAEGSIVLPNSAVRGSQGLAWVLKDPSSNEMKENFVNCEKPSIYFCKTGKLDIEIGEVYNQNIHNYCKTIHGRASQFYSKEEIQKMEKEME